MPVNSSYEVKDGYVLITSEGERKDFSSVVEGTTRIYEIIDKTKCHLALLDYRKVIFNVPQTDAYNIIRLYELKMPALKNIKMAAVVSKIMPGFASVWKDVAQSKGFKFETFTDMNEAVNWLLMKD